MTSTAPEALALLGRAADLRAGGLPWPAVAAELAVEVGEIRRLVVQNGRAYDRVARHARLDFARETMGATVARLRELLKSQQEGVALTAAVTLVRYDMARMRREQQARAARGGRRKRRRRDDLPPPPSRTVTAESTRCDTPAPAPETPTPQQVGAEPALAKSGACDRRDTPPGTPPSSPPASVVPAPPIVKPRPTGLPAAIRRKQWLPAGLGD